MPRSTLVWLGFVLVGLVGWLALGTAPARAADDAGQPNILVILADDLGYGDLSSYGADKLQTPNIDQLAERGMRFDRFYANCPVCSPTRAAMFTGRYPDLVGVPGVIRDKPRNSWGYLSPDATTLATMLNRGDYHTALIGKWHLGLREENHPNSRGFDFFHGFLGDMMDDYYTHRRHGHNFMRRNRTKIDPKGHATTLFTEWSQKYLQRRAEKDNPFFLALTYNAPHAPIQPPKEWVKKVKQREPDISNKRAKFAALTEHMDHGIGQVIETLKQTGQYKNTLIIFTSDNGGANYHGASNGKLRGQKQDMYEGGIRVPTIAVWPGRIEPGSQSNTLAATMDIFATACDVAGVSIDYKVEARSFLPTLKGESQPKLNDRPLIFVRREGNMRYLGDVYYAVIDWPWKLLQNEPFQGLELYNLEKDPREQNNLINSKRGKRNQLGKILMRHIERAGHVPWQKPNDQ
jgi:arylsulfatase A-like enzyme